jgi:hypothetical protein
MFTRDQVAWLMAQAQRWGYEAKTDEVNAETVPEPVSVSRSVDRPDGLPAPV